MSCTWGQCKCFMYDKVTVCLASFHNENDGIIVYKEQTSNRPL